MGVWDSFKEDYKWIWNTEAYNIRQKELKKKRKAKAKRSAERRAEKGKPLKKRKPKDDWFDDQLGFDGSD
ncbi:MAG: hypothetical protein CL431_07145 [Acidimicrobiaceae bacterium]|jgi:hypothetical protein|nr:hypothetical protein [Acidimicrobiaceae bacterium]|tara:strand:- start:351 stop:560 length:210 start_codon:yes stop_codon:yes gene_type:complete